MKRYVALILLFVAIGLTGTVAPAQTLSKILAQSGLTPEDFKLMNAAEDSLYKTRAPVAGRSASWSNPDSKSRGVVSLAAVQNNCVYVQSIIYPKGETRPRELRKRMCKAADGAWLLTP